MFCEKFLLSGWLSRERLVFNKTPPPPWKTGSYSGPRENEFRAGQVQVQTPPPRPPVGSASACPALSSSWHRWAVKPLSTRPSFLAWPIRCRQCPCSYSERRFHFPLISLLGPLLNPPSAKLWMCFFLRYIGKKKKGGRVPEVSSQHSIFFLPGLELKRSTVYDPSAQVSNLRSFLKVI